MNIDTVMTITFFQGKVPIVKIDTWLIMIFSQVVHSNKHLPHRAKASDVLWFYLGRFLAHEVIIETICDGN